MRMCGLLTLDIACIENGSYFIHSLTRVCNMPDDDSITPLKLTRQYSELRLCTLSHIQLGFVQFVFTFHLPTFKHA
jgi:hypothetical protein